MKHTLFILALITASIQTFAQSPRIKLNQITKDSLTGSVLISSPTDSGMVYSRDLFVSYGADTFLILGGDTIALKSDLVAEIGDSLVNYVSRTELSDSTTNIRTDIPLIISDSLLNYVTISGTQTITGEKTFSTDVIIDGKLDLNEDNNVYIGTDVGRVDDGSDNKNVGVGYRALYSNTSGAQNTANGYETLYSNTEGINNIAIGYEALYTNTTGNYNTANGYQALYSNSSGSFNIANGYQALYSNTSGIRNTANGGFALYTNSSGNNNIANGYQSLFSNTSGEKNTANGGFALYSNTEGINNIANGYEALYTNTTGNYNTANGVQALYSNSSGSFNIANGYQALYSNTSGIRNIANGGFALFSNTVGENNIANGYQSLFSNTSGEKNTANGGFALYSNTVGINNTAIGYEAGRYISTGANNTDGDNSVFIGYDSRPQLDSQANQIVIGYQARGLGTNTAIIGNGSLTDIYNGADNANFSTVSDARDKTNIEPLELGLNLIEKLNPVAFVWDKRDSTRVGVKDIGFIAQEFDGALYALPHSNYADFVKITSDGNWKLNLSDIYPVIVKAIQEQQAIIESQATEIKTLKTLTTELSNRLTILENN